MQMFDFVERELLAALDEEQLHSNGGKNRRQVRPFQRELSQ